MVEGAERNERVKLTGFEPSSEVSSPRGWTPARSPLRLSLLGPPGAGKGTQGIRLAKSLGLTYLGVGQLLRDKRRSKGFRSQSLERHMQQGHLVPDGIIVSVLRGRLKSADRHGGYVLDGYPRTLIQACNMERDFGNSGCLDLVLLLEVPEEELGRRLANRLRKEGRPDDAIDIQRARLSVHKREIAAVIEHYEAAGLLARIDGSPSVNNVTETILATLASRGLAVQVTTGGA